MKRTNKVKLTLDSGGKLVTRVADPTRAVGFTISSTDTIEFTLSTDGTFRLDRNGVTEHTGVLR